MIKAYIFHY